MVGSLPAWREQQIPALGVALTRDFYRSSTCSGFNPEDTCILAVSARSSLLDKGRVPGIGPLPSAPEGGS